MGPSCPPPPSCIGNSARPWQLGEQELRDHSSKLLSFWMVCSTARDNWQAAVHSTSRLALWQAAGCVPAYCAHIPFQSAGSSCSSPTPIQLPRICLASSRRSFRGSGALGSWFQCGPTLAVPGIWRVSQWREHPSASVSVTLPSMQMKTNLEINIMSFYFHNLKNT